MDPGGSQAHTRAVPEMRHGVWSRCSPRAPRAREYTCPMHPEVVRAEPGACPKCGMALEPSTVTADERNPELDDMPRRFRIAWR